MKTTRSGWLPATLVALAAGVYIDGRVEAQGTTYEYTAVVEKTALRQGAVNAGGINWKCEANRCTVKGPWPAPGVGSCAALAREVGRLVSYGHPGRSLDAKEMSECNRNAAKPGSAPAPTPTLTPGRIEARPGGIRDEDGDNHPTDDDCDDRDPRRFPGNPEIGDTEGHDEDCDPSTFGAVDLDKDGHFDARYFNRPPGSRENTSAGTDCNDGDGSVHPAQVDICNRVDDDCDGVVDEGVQLRAWRDEDHDLFGDPRTGAMTCPQNLSPGWVVNDFDCDDADARKNPYFGNCGG
jgi:hypothetical protein